MDRLAIELQVEEMRTRLRTGSHRQYEGLALRCLVFYADMQPLLQSGEFAGDTAKIEGLCEVFHSTALIVSAFEQFADCFRRESEGARENKRGLQMLTLFGMVQAVTQTIEAASHISMLACVTNEVMKTRDYWAFRNRLNHVLLDPKRSSTKGIDKDLPLNEFKIIPGSIDTISYRSSGAPGYAVRHITLSETAALLQFDLKQIFDAILEGRTLRVSDAQGAVEIGPNRSAQLKAADAAGG